MARTRFLAPGFFRNEALGECSPLARLLFAGLWCWADREGRLEDRPRRLKAEILPYDQGDGVHLVAELQLHGLVTRYEVDGVKVLQVVNFDKYQKPHPNETASRLPPPTSDGAPKVNHGGTNGAPSPDLGGAMVAPCQPRSSRSSRSSGEAVPPSRAREAGASDGVAILGRDETFAQKYPRTAAVLAALEQLATPGAWPRDPDTRAAVEAAVGAQPPDQVAARLGPAIASSGKPWLGHHLPAIRRPAAPASAGSSAPPDLAWIDQLPEPRRAEARAAWDAKQAEVARSFHAGAVPRILVTAAQALRDEFATRAAGGSP